MLLPFTLLVPRPTLSFTQTETEIETEAEAETETETKTGTLKSSAMKPGSLSVRMYVCICEILLTLVKISQTAVSIAGRESVGVACGKPVSAVAQSLPHVACHMLQIITSTSLA